MTNLTLNYLWKKLIGSLSSTVIWGLLGIITIFGGTFLGWIVFPQAVKDTIASKINLGDNSEVRKYWIESPSVNFNAYIFNITNPSEVMNGEKPVVTEVGPYCYTLVQEKVIKGEDPVDDTITYQVRSTWHFNQNHTSCAGRNLTGEEIVTVPNVPMMSILLVAEKDQPAPFMSVFNLALPELFGGFFIDVFLRAPARTILFDGIYFDCSRPSIISRPVCKAVRKHSKAFKEKRAGVYGFSFLGKMNGTLESNNQTVKRGVFDSEDVGRLVAINGRPELPYWRDKCNAFQGTDGSIFPPFRKPDNFSLAAYSSEICRVLSATYDGEYDYKGVKGYSYSGTLGDTDTNPEDKCYCAAQDRCFKKGTLDAYKCKGAPLVFSLPHFYEANTEYLNGTVGLHPDKEKHGVYAVLEPLTAVPLTARKRVQVNMELKPITWTLLTRNLRRTLVPLFWIEEIIDLDDDMLGDLKKRVLRPIEMAYVGRWVVVAAGVCMLLTAVLLKISKYRRDKVYAFNGPEVYDDSALDYGNILCKMQAKHDNSIRPSVENGSNIPNVHETNN